MSATDPGSRAAIVVLAGGVGARVGAGINKALLEIAGQPVIARSVRTALDAGSERVLVVVRPEDRAALSTAIQPVLHSDEVWVVDGGVERHDSEWNALVALTPLIEGGQIDVIAIHDAARPLAPLHLFTEALSAARDHGGAIPVVAMDHLVGNGIADQRTVAVQTPQAFRAAELLAAYRAADAEGFRATDTAGCIERYSDLTIVGIPSSTTNLKVTYPEDLAVAEELLSRS